LSRPSTTGSPPSSRPGKRVDVLRSRSRCLKRATPRRGNLSLRAPAASSRIVWPGCIDEPVRYPAVTLKQAVSGCAPTPRRGVLTRRRLQRSDRTRPSEESQRTSNRHTPCAVETAPKCCTAGANHVSPKCLLENVGRRCGESVAFRSPCGVAHEVPAAGVNRLAFVRRASRTGFATEWLKRGSSTNSLQAGVEGHQNLDQASDQVEHLALCCVVPPRQEGSGHQKLGPQVPSFGSIEGGMRWR
jgi:hypothetical protein